MSDGFGPDELLDLYRRGVFPMGEDADDANLFIVDPDFRGIFPLDGLRISRSLRKVVARDVFHVTVNAAFTSVMEACADRDSTWINTPIINLYSALHRRGQAHSVECWQDGELVGGLYGVSLGGAFFGESMFSTVSNASKVALVHLAARLIAGNYQLLDTQFLTDHLESLGAIEIPRAEFQEKLKAALAIEGNFYSVSELTSGNPEESIDGLSGASNPSPDSSYSPRGSSSFSGKAALQLITHTS
ncbi:leucyl/phenylalanyl-tRNA--protein transferase [Hirschia litorea]|uniref:Leucyl/phenylalanyl-tRNA--protein transferase n=1 Tax=Hirschia litorea TaxID=1199156 RepID=A0ABW2IIW8_9PROT